MQELSNITLHEVPDDVPRMEQFGEWHMRPTPVAVPCTKTGTQEEETGQDSLLAEGGTDVCLVECHAESEQMSPDTTEVAMREVEIMDIEPQEKAVGELAGLGAWQRRIPGQSNRVWIWEPLLQRMGTHRSHQCWENPWQMVP